MSLMGVKTGSSIRARLWDSGTDGMCPSVPTIEGEKSARIKGFEYVDGTVGTVGTLDVWTRRRSSLAGAPTLLALRLRGYI